MLLRAGLLDRGELVVLQPRRIAARMLARRVAEELGSTLGQAVGYQVRFEKVTSPRTRIRFVTEGVLLRQMIGDPELTGVAALIFDEIHERHLYADITLARALELQARCPELRVIVMSATLDLPRLEAYLTPCTTVCSDGRAYPVELEYLPEPSARAAPTRSRGPTQRSKGVASARAHVSSPSGRAPSGSPRAPSAPQGLGSQVSGPKVWDLAADAFARARPAGDTLVFMPGAYEIRRTIQAIEARRESRGYIVLPLHGELSSAEQDAALAPATRPRVIVATNVAETSLTIDGIRLVIDSGLVRMPRHDPERGINTLRIDRISRASADQRAGRAGRTGPGRCLRLWTERDHAQRLEREIPEIKRLDLAEVVLLLRACGVTDVRALRWLDPPDARPLAHAESLLADLGAIRDGDVTPLGHRMLELPVHPRHARLLLAAEERGCVEDALRIVALAQGRDLLTQQAEEPDRILGGRATSDFELLARAHRYAALHRFDVETCRRAGIRAQSAREASALVEQLRRGLRRSPGARVEAAANDDALRQCLLIAFSDRIARCDPATGRCDLLGGRRGVLSSRSVVRGHALLVAAEIREIEGKQLRTEVALVTAIDAAWLKELFPNALHEHIEVRFDAPVGRVVAERQQRFRDLVLSATAVDPPPDRAAELLADEVMRGRVSLPKWDDAVEQWTLRLSLLSSTCPELGLSALGDDARRAILEQLFLGARHVKAIRDLPIVPSLSAWLSPAQQEMLRQHAPERLRLANGKMPRLRYAANALPHIALRIQELFDVRDVPRIALGRVAPLVHVLAPNMRPMQVTHDLAGFWRDHYPGLRKSLARRYPKHEWR